MENRLESKYVQFNHPNGSVGKIVEAHPTIENRYYVEWVYGRDVNGNPMTTTGGYDSSELIPVTEEVYTGVLNRKLSETDFDTAKAYKVSKSIISDVKHPKHYNSHPSGVECIVIAQHHNFNIGSAIKYLWRQGLKDGESSIKDLSKAIQYIQFEIQRIKEENKNDKN